MSIVSSDDASGSPPVSTKSVRTTFHLAARDLYGRLVWRWLRFEALIPAEAVQEDAAKRLGRVPKALSEGLTHGKLTLEMLIDTLAVIGRNVTELPALPTAFALRIAGTTAALPGLNSDVPIAADQVTTLAAVENSVDWIELYYRQNHARRYRTAFEQATQRLILRADQMYETFVQISEPEFSGQNSQTRTRTEEAIVALHETWGQPWQNLADITERSIEFEDEDDDDSDY